MAKSQTQYLLDGIAALDSLGGDYDYTSTYTIEFVASIGRVVEAMKFDGVGLLKDRGTLDAKHVEMQFGLPDGGNPIFLTFTFEK